MWVKSQKTKTKTWFGSKVKRQRQRHDVGLKTKTRTWCGSKPKNYKLSPEKDNGSAFLLCLDRNPYRGDQGSLALQPTTHQQWKDRFHWLANLAHILPSSSFTFYKKAKVILGRLTNGGHTYSIGAQPSKSVAFCKWQKRGAGADLVFGQSEGGWVLALASQKHCYSISGRERPLQPSFRAEDTFP